VASRSSVQSRLRSRKSPRLYRSLPVKAVAEQSGEADIQPVAGTSVADEKVIHFCKRVPLTEVPFTVVLACGVTLRARRSVP
jgi:hypothetical protein